MTPPSRDDLAGRLRARSTVTVDRHREQLSFFERDGRRYFEVAYVPLGATRSPPVLLLHSFGFEQVTLHPIEARVARTLADAGFPALAVQAQGYGDSSGDFADVRRATQVRDALVARDRLKERFGPGPAALVGVRFGAAVALLSAEERPAASAVLIQPVARGKPYFEAMVRGAAVARMASGHGGTPKALRRSLEEGGVLDLEGYAVHGAQFLEGLELDLPSQLRSAPADVTIVEAARGSKRDADSAALSARLTELGARVTSERIPVRGGPELTPPVPHVVPPVTHLEVHRAVAAATLRFLEGLSIG